MEHHAFRFTALNLNLLGNVSEVVIVKSYASTCTLRLQRLLPDPDTDISMMISKIWYNKCSSHIGLVPKPKTCRYAPKYIRETLHKLPLLSLTWFCILRWPGVLSHGFMFAPIVCFHNKTGIRWNSANSCAIACVFTRVHVFTYEFNNSFNHGHSF